MSRGLWGTLLAVLAVAVASHAGEPATTDHASGVVFHDVDRDGERDWFELGVRGVVVSNGDDVVRTDWRGRYRIPVSDDSIVFVVKPGGWATPVTEDGLPRFYYIHKPTGSPTDLAFAGVAPTGPLPVRIDFPLHRSREPRDFRAIVLADPQPYTTEQLEWFERDVVDELVGTHAAFGITLGDIVGDDLSLLEPTNRAVGRIGIPWYNAIGNHDLNFLAADDRHSDETFERIYGPTDYAFVYGSAHFIVLDDVVYSGAKTDGSIGPYRGGLSEHQLRFVERYLATVPRDRLVVLAMHIPFNSPPHTVPERDRLLEILADRPHTLSLVGHTHFQESQFFDTGQGQHHQLIAATASGSWWLGAPDADGIPHATMRCGAPNGYSILEVDGNGYSIRFKPARQPAGYQMNVYAPTAVSADEAGDVEVVVNVFAGSAQTRVELRLGEDADWIPLTRESRGDPNYLALIQRDLLRVPRPRFYLPPAINSPHLWVGTLPHDPPRGIYSLEVRAVDRYGHLHTDRREIRVD